MATMFVYVWKNYAAIHVPELRNALLDWDRPVTVQAFPGTDLPMPTDLAGDDYDVPYRFHRYPQCKWERFIGADDAQLRNFIHRLGQGSSSCFKKNSFSVRWKNPFSMVAQCLMECLPAKYANQRDIGKIYGSWDHKDLGAYMDAVTNSQGYYDHMINTLMLAQQAVYN